MTTATATRKVAPRAQVAAVKAAVAAQVTAENYAEFGVYYAMETCGRCGGTGMMPFAAYGGVCFKCGRAGRHFTPAGRKAYHALEAKRDEVYGVPWSEVEVGDTVWWSDSRTWRAVLTKEAQAPDALRVNGVPVPTFQVTRAKKSDTTYVVHAATVVRKHSVAGAVEVLKLAATLSGVQVSPRVAS